MSTSKGLTDPLYWRRVVQGGHVFHCFRKVPRRNGHKVYESLCGRFIRERSGGQQCARPPALMRCGRCDGEEIACRGVEESMPESPDWREYHE